MTNEELVEKVKGLEQEIAALRALVEHINAGGYVGKGSDGKLKPYMHPDEPPLGKPDNELSHVFAREGYCDALINPYLTDGKPIPGNKFVAKK